MSPENFIVDDSGRRIAVMLSIKRYKQMLEALEELEDIKEYRIAKTHKGKAIPFDQAFSEIEGKK